MVHRKWNVDVLQLRWSISVLILIAIRLFQAHPSSASCTLWHCASLTLCVNRICHSQNCSIYYVEETWSEVFFQLLWCYCQSWFSARIKTKRKKKKKKCEHILEWFYNVHCVYCLSLFCMFISLTCSTLFKHDGKDKIIIKF